MSIDTEAERVNILRIAQILRDRRLEGGSNLSYDCATARQILALGIPETEFGELEALPAGLSPAQLARADALNSASRLIGSAVAGMTMVDLDAAIELWLKAARAGELFIVNAEDVASVDCDHAHPCPHAP